MCLTSSTKSSLAHTVPRSPRAAEDRLRREVTTSAASASFVGYGFSLFRRQIERFKIIAKLTSLFSRVRGRCIL